MHPESLLAAIDHLAELERKATQGKHVVQTWINPDALVVRVEGSGDDSAVAEYGPLAKDDAELHAAMRNSLPELLACARTLVQFASIAPEQPVNAAAREVLDALSAKLSLLSQ